MYEKDIPNGCYCCDFRDFKYNHCLASRDGDEYMSCSQPKSKMNGKKPIECPIRSIESLLIGGKKVEYKRLTKLSDLGTLHALDFNREEQPLCELTALDIDVLIGRLYELENKGELGVCCAMKILIGGSPCTYWSKKKKKITGKRSQAVLAGSCLRII